MKRKSIIIALITILCICIGIGVFQTVNGKSEENITKSVSSTLNTSENEFKTERITDDSIERTSAASNDNTSKTKASTKSVLGTTVNSSNKSEKSTAASSAKTSVTQRTTAKKNTTAATKRAATSKTTTTEKKSFKVSITISCKNAVAYGADVPNYMLSTRSITVNRGDTVFDALKAVCSANGISLKYQSIYYVQGIGGLNEKDCGATSGWMYRVNGVAPNKAAAKYTLSPGDKIEWYYVTSPNDR